MERERDAIGLINETLDEHADGASGTELGEMLRKRSEEALSAEEQQKVSAYISGLREETRGAAIEVLDDGVGGMYDGSNVLIAAETLKIHESIEQTLRRMEEVKDHEDFHREHRHTEAMIHGNSAEGNVAVTFGGESFTQEELIEGWTVKNTGNTFVSKEYRNHEERLENAKKSAGLSDEDLSRAIDREKDLRIIDDAKMTEEQDHSIAA